MLFSKSIDNIAFRTVYWPNVKFKYRDMRKNKIRISFLAIKMHPVYQVF